MIGQIFRQLTIILVDEINEMSRFDENLNLGLRPFETSKNNF